MSVRRFLVHQSFVAALLGLPVSALAQGDAGSLGFSFEGAVPSGDFRQFTNFAGGAGAQATVNLGAGSPIGIRLEATGLVYGTGYQVVPQAYYPLSVRTTYGMGTLGIGPQITIGSGPMRLYGFATIGGSYISTWSSYSDGGCGCVPWGGGTDFSDWTAAYRAGGGLQLRMGGPRSSTMLDLGASYLHNDPAWYVVPGSVVTAPDGSIHLATVRSPTELVTFHVGVSVILR